METMKAPQLPGEHQANPATPGPAGPLASSKSEGPGVIGSFMGMGMVGFWFGIGFMLAVKTINNLEELIRR